MMSSDSDSDDDVPAECRHTGSCNFGTGAMRCPCKGRLPGEPGKCQCGHPICFHKHRRNRQRTQIQNRVELNSLRATGTPRTSRPTGASIDSGLYNSFRQLVGVSGSSGGLASSSTSSSSGTTNPSDNGQVFLAASRSTSRKRPKKSRQRLEDLAEEPEIPLPLQVQYTLFLLESPSVQIPAAGGAAILIMQDAGLVAYGKFGGMESASFYETVKGCFFLEDADEIMLLKPAPRSTRHLEPLVLSPNEKPSLEAILRDRISANRVLSNNRIYLCPVKEELRRKIATKMYESRNRLDSLKLRTFHPSQIAADLSATSRHSSAMPPPNEIPEQAQSRTENSQSARSAALSTAISPLRTERASNETVRTLDPGVHEPFVQTAGVSEITASSSSRTNLTSCQPASEEGALVPNDNIRRAARVTRAATSFSSLSGATRTNNVPFRPYNIRSSALANPDQAREEIARAMNRSYTVNVITVDDQEPPASNRDEDENRDPERMYRSVIGEVEEADPDDISRIVHEMSLNSSAPLATPPASFAGPGRMQRHAFGEMNLNSDTYSSSTPGAVVGPSRLEHHASGERNFNFDALFSGPPRAATGPSRTVYRASRVRRRPVPYTARPSVSPDPEMQPLFSPPSSPVSSLSFPEVLDLSTNESLESLSPSPSTAAPSVVPVATPQYRHVPERFAARLHALLAMKPAPPARDLQRDFGADSEGLTFPVDLFDRADPLTMSTVGKDVLPPSFSHEQFVRNFQQSLDLSMEHGRQNADETTDRPEISLPFDAPLPAVMDFFTKASSADLARPSRFRYDGALDHGGVTKDIMEKFWTMLFDEESIKAVVDEGKMFRPWEKAESGAKFYLPSTNSTVATENWTRMAGKAYLFSIMKQLPLPSKLDPVLLRSMLGIKFDLNVVFNYNPLAGKIALYLKTYQREAMDGSGLVDLAKVPFLLDWLDNFETEKEHILEQFRKCTPIELSEEVVKFALFGSRMLHLCNFRDAFLDIDLHKRLTFYNMWGYLEATNFKIVSTAAELFENFDTKHTDGAWFDNLEEKERFVYLKLVDWINAAPPEDLQALMVFITGSAMPLVNDLITIEFSHIRREEPEGRKPTSSTCYNIVRLCTAYGVDEELEILRDFDTAFHYVKMGLA